jgi:lipoprotein-anchoring transpeptidase ErfK/SrfK
MPTPRTQPRMHASRASAAIIAVLLIVAGAACAGSDAGSGYAVSGDDLRATTTVPVDLHITTVATATVPKLEVFTDKPADQPDDLDTAPTQAQPASMRTTAVAQQTKPIPRQGLNSAGATKTDTGYTFDNPTYNDKPLTLVVTGLEGEWVKVLLPARPNGTEGWVKAGDVVLSEHNYHGTIDISDRHLTMWEGDDVIADTPVVVGKDNTPTPLGRIYISEVLSASEAGVYPGGAYGPNILPTNAYSEALDLFDGGLPVIAFHGTNQPDLLGSASSNGCVRMPNEVVTHLAETLPAGTPVDIVE